MMVLRDVVAAEVRRVVVIEVLQDDFPRPHYLHLTSCLLRVRRRWEQGSEDDYRRLHVVRRHQFPANYLYPVELGAIKGTIFLSKSRICPVAHDYISFTIGTRWCNKLPGIKMFGCTPSCWLAS
ncbi:hypothetical protein RB195_021528 [Necator americanus]|uniref:Uncharacterized protein n=1 Tax=Necator americanus TaxID=51031 RepID=A0ABR1EC58_NECAM